MCTTCGCSSGDLSIDGHPVEREAGHFHAPTRRGFCYLGKRNGQAHKSASATGPLNATHAPGVSTERVLQIEQDLLAKNDAYALRNRQRLAQQGIFALNLVSSPGSGKTTLLVETIKRWQQAAPVAVVEGDQQTSNDAERIRATGAPAVQINTGKGCHLDAHMLGQALDHLQQEKHLVDDSLLLVENVGNLVCPAAFDLGEAHKVVILSVTEGEDKPLKYPDMFRAAELMLLSKTDLLPYLDFDADAAEQNARKINPGIRTLRVSTKTGVGFDAWLAWLRAGCEQAQHNKS